MKVDSTIYKLSSDNQTDRQTDRQTNRQRQTDGQMNVHLHFLSFWRSQKEWERSYADLVECDDPVASVQGGGGQLIHQVGGEWPRPADHEQQPRARVITQWPEALTRGRGQSVRGEGVLLKTEIDAI